jgi:predicted ATP-grasp superfamily ATP-dependent carboligase
MNDLIRLWEIPDAAEYVIAGWHQWADAGDVSSGLPKYLIEQTAARRIGEMEPDGFYLFQIPGTHHLLRPMVKLSEGYRETLEERRNEFFYSGDDENGFLIFLGEEPHQNAECYAEAFFDAVEELGVKRVAALGGVHGPVPYDRERDISCVYSLPRMKDELAQCEVRFSDYEGGATITTYLADKAEARGVEFFSFYAFVPAYNFSESSMIPHQVAMEEDFKAWYDLMRRLDHMFRLGLDLSDLARRSDELIVAWEKKIDHLARAMPQLGVSSYMEQVNEDFAERRFLPFSDFWEEVLGDLMGAP